MKMEAANFESDHSCDYNCCSDDDIRNENQPRVFDYKRNHVGNGLNDVSPLMNNRPSVFNKHQFNHQEDGRNK